MESMWQISVRVNERLPPEDRKIFNVMAQDSSSWAQVPPAVMACICALNPDDEAKRVRLYADYVSNQPIEKTEQTRDDRNVNPPKREPAEVGQSKQDGQKNTRHCYRGKRSWNSEGERGILSKRNRTDSPRRINPTLRVGARRPFVNGFELVGDSTSRRLAVQLGCDSIELDGKQRVGFCVGGATIGDVIEILEKDRKGVLSDKLIIMAGTNDVLKVSL